MAKDKTVKPKMGRPVEYTDEIIRGYADEMVQWFLASDENVFIKDFFISKQLPSEYASRWADKSDYFHHAYKRCKDIQEQRLVNGAIRGDYDRVFSIFTLKNVAGWRDKQEHEIAGKDGAVQIDVKFSKGE